MKVFLLAITAALAIASGLYMMSDAEGSNRLLVTDSAIEASWANWRAKYGKTYGTSSDEAYRKQVFTKWYHFVTKHNATPGVTFTMALNPYADLTHEEFLAQKANLPQRDTDDCERWKIFHIANGL